MLPRLSLIYQLSFNDYHASSSSSTIKFNTKTNYNTILPDALSRDEVKTTLCY